MTIGMLFLAAGQAPTPPVAVPSPAVKAHSGAVNALVVTPDGKMLASGSADKAIKLWRLAESRWLATLKDHTSPVNALALTQVGRKEFRSFFSDAAAQAR